MKTIYSGLESSGKSYKLAMQATELVDRNSEWLKKQEEYYEKEGESAFLLKYGYMRPTARKIASNLKFSKEFVEYANSKGVEIVYWHDIEELIKLQNCDILIDEVANYFDSRMWQELSLDVRRWLTQGAKTGVEIYGTAQDFAQVDKAFRRLVNKLYHIKKIIGSRRPSPTKPPVQQIWGVCLINELDPQTYNEEKSKFNNTGILEFNFMWLEKKYCEIFDTTQKIERSKPAFFKHIERKCGDENCKFHKTIHI